MIRTAYKQVRRLLAARFSAVWLRGQVDGASDTSLTGWAFSLRDPKRRLVILVACPDGEIRAARADRYRADVHAAGLGSDGYCGFSVALPPGAAAAPLRAMVAPSMAVLPAGARRGAGGEAGGMVQARAGLHVVVEAGGGQLTGWVRAANDGGRRLLRLDHGGASALRTRACLYDRRAEHQGGDGFHGYSIPIPIGAGTVRLVDEATGAELHRTGS